MKWTFFIGLLVSSFAAVMSAPASPIPVTTTTPKPVARIETVMTPPIPQQPSSNYSATSPKQTTIAANSAAASLPSAQAAATSLVAQFSPAAQQQLLHTLIAPLLLQAASNPLMSVASPGAAGIASPMLNSLQSSLFNPSASSGVNSRPISLLDILAGPNAMNNLNANALGLQQLRNAVGSRQTLPGLGDVNSLLGLLSGGGTGASNLGNNILSAASSVLVNGAPNIPSLLSGSLSPSFGSDAMGGLSGLLGLNGLSDALSGGMGVLANGMGGGNLGANFLDALLTRSAAENPSPNKGSTKGLADSILPNLDTGLPPLAPESILNTFGELSPLLGDNALADTVSQLLLNLN